MINILDLCSTACAEDALSSPFVPTLTAFAA